MITLQVQSFGVFETLTQYGALGVVTLALGYVVWSLLKRQIASEDRLKAKVEEIENTPLGEGSLLDRNEMLKAILANKKSD